MALNAQQLVHQPSMLNFKRRYKRMLFGLDYTLGTQKMNWVESNEYNYGGPFLLLWKKELFYNNGQFNFQVCGYRNQYGNFRALP